MESVLDSTKEIIEILKETKTDDKSLVSIPDVKSLLSLPTSLRKTMLALYKMGEATAPHLSRETGRLRPIESSSLNQLERMGYVRKFRKGRKVYFTVRQPIGDFGL